MKNMFHKKKQKYIKFKTDKGKFKTFKIFSDEKTGLNIFDDNLRIREFDYDVTSTASDIECAEQEIFRELEKTIRYIKVHKIKFKSSY